MLASRYMIAKRSMTKRRRKVAIDCSVSSQQREEFSRQLWAPQQALVVPIPPIRLTVVPMKIKKKRQKSLAQLAKLIREIGNFCQLQLSPSNLLILVRLIKTGKSKAKRETNYACHHF